MGKDFTAIISGKSERAEDWRQVMGSRTVNIKSPYPSRANLPGRPNALIYELDLDLLTSDQRERLIKFISEKFGIPEPDVNRDFDKMGCPILADDVTISISNPQKWF